MVSHRAAENLNKQMLDQIPKIGDKMEMVEEVIATIGHEYDYLIIERA